MFCRWTQENFFKYLRSDYDLDRIVHYLVNEINKDFEVVNPLHRKLTNILKKTREKIARRKAKLYELIHENLNGDADETEKNVDKQILNDSDTKFPGTNLKLIYKFATI